MRLRFLSLLLLLLMLAPSAFAQLAQCTVTGTLYKPDATVCASCQIKIVKTYKNGALISITPITVTSNGSGVISFTVPRGSITWLSGNVIGFSQCGNQGCPVSIPDASSATLETLVPSPTNLPNSYPVAVSGSATNLDALTDVVITSPATGQGLIFNGTNWVNQALAGNGTVTSVALSLPNIFSVSGSPVTSSGTLAATLANQNANLVFAGPGSGGAAAPTFRALVAADLPDLSAVYSPVAHTHSFASLTSKPTTLSGYGITDAQALDADLTSIAGLAGTSGLLRKTAADTWTLDTASYLTANQTITLSGDVTGSGTTAITATIANNAITNAKLATVATATFKGRTTAGTGNVEDLTGTQATALLDTFTSGAKGLAPASGGGTTNFLRADGTWAAPPGGGGSLTVEEADGTPSLGSTTTLRFDQADGFVVTNPSGAIARVDLSAVPYANLNLTGSIVNADVNAGAAIALSKLAPLTASRLLVSDGSGVVSVSAVTSTEAGYLSGVTSAIQTQLNAKQVLDGTLTALAAYNTNGLLVQTAADTFAGRTITAGVGIAITDGNGVGGNPTIAADINSLTADATPDGAADYVMTYDASAAGLKKVLLNNLPGGGGGTPGGSGTELQYRGGASTFSAVTGSSVANGGIAVVSQSATQIAGSFTGAASATVPVLDLNLGATPGSGGDALRVRNSSGTVLTKFTSSGFLDLPVSSTTTPSLTFNTPTTGIRGDSSNIYLLYSGVYRNVFDFANNAFRFDSGGHITFSNSSGNAAASAHAGITSPKAGTIRPSNGSTGNGNILLGSSTVGDIGTSGLGVLAIANGTAPGSRPADTVQLYAADHAAGDSRLVVLSEANGLPLILGNGILQLGGNTSSFPQLRRSTTGISVELADGSANTWLSASTLYPQKSFVPTVTSVSLSANQNDWSPTQAPVLRVSLTANVDVTGLAFTQESGQQVLIRNVSASNLTLKHQSASSTAENRFLCSTGADIVLSQNQAADLEYDATTQRWFVYKRN